MKEIADAYTFRLAGKENLGERETLMIDVALDMGHGLQRHAQGFD